MLDLSRELRMDQQDSPKAVSGIIEPVDPEQGAQPGTGSSVVFFGDPALVREGFAMALRAMGIGAPIPDAVPREQSEKGD
jgi:hypothetical protein